MPEALPAVTVPSFLNAAPQLGHAFDARVGARVLVGVEHGHAFARLQFDRQDLLLEIAFLDGVDRAAVALHRKLVLLRARNAPFLGDVLGGDAHVHGVEGIGERAHHHVDRAAVAHALAPAQRRHQVAAAAHRFRAAGKRDVGVAEQDGLRRADDGLHAAAAQAVQRHRRRVVGQARIDHGHARQVHVLGLGMNHVAEHHVADFVGIDLGARHRFARDLGREFGRRDVFQRAAVITDCGAHTAHHHDFSAHLDSP